MNYLLSAVLALVCLSVSAVEAAPKGSERKAKDPVPDLLKSAYLKYSKQDLNGASEDLTKAQSLIDEQRANQGVELLIDLEGWNAVRAVKQDGSAAGAGIVIKRNYEKGAQGIVAEITMDSPLVQSLAPLLTNPDIAAASGMEMERINGKDALVKEGEQTAEVNVWLGNGLLFKLTGSGGVKAHDLVALARKFDLKAMEGLKKDVGKDEKSD